MATLQPEKRRSRARAIPRLAWIVAADIIRSNIAVARIVLSPARRDRVASFVRLPLDMRNRYGLPVLACFITAPRGTMWVQFDRAKNMLLLHVLDLIDTDEWKSLIKRRYESLLRELFE